jgi:hypothetical protein
MIQNIYIGLMIGYKLQFLKIKDIDVNNIDNKKKINILV